MEEFNTTFERILKNKASEFDNSNDMKDVNKKMIDNKDVINYCVKSTLCKINAEQEKKLKASKAYQKEQQMFQ